MTSTGSYLHVGVLLQPTDSLCTCVYCTSQFPICVLPLITHLCVLVYRCKKVPNQCTPKTRQPNQTKQHHLLLYIQSHIYSVIPLILRAASRDPPDKARQHRPRAARAFETTRCNSTMGGKPRRCKNPSTLHACPSSISISSSFFSFLFIACLESRSVHVASPAVHSGCTGMRWRCVCHRTAKM